MCFRERDQKPSLQRSNRTMRGRHRHRAGRTILPGGHHDDLQGDRFAQDDKSRRFAGATFQVRR
jgi:hypothetical protein